MSFTCPHCTKDIEGATTEKILKERLENQGSRYKEQLDEAKRQLLEKTALNEQLKKDAERLPAIESELNGIKSERERASAYAEVGLEPGRHVDRLSSYVNAIYSEHKTEAGDKALSLTEFLKGQLEGDDANPMLAAFRKAEPAAGAKVEAPSPPIPPKRSTTAPPKDPSLVAPPVVQAGAPKLDELRKATARTTAEKGSLLEQLDALANAG